MLHLSRSLIWKKCSVTIRQCLRWRYVHTAHAMDSLNWDQPCISLSVHVSWCKRILLTSPLFTRTDYNIFFPRSRSDGFPQRTWMKKESSEGRTFTRPLSFKIRNHLSSAALSDTYFTPSPRKITQEKKKMYFFFFFVVFCWKLHFFPVSVSTTFLYLQLCISFAYVCKFFKICGRVSCLICVQVEGGKGINSLLASVCSADAFRNRGHRG